MRVVIDARALSHPQVGGYRSYVAALIQGLAARGGAEELVLYLDRPLPKETQRQLPRGCQVRLLSPSRLKSDFFLFQRQVRRDRPDLVHGTVNYLPPGLRCRTVLTLHDALLLRRYPWEAMVSRDRRQRLLNAYWSALARWSARTATRLLTISHGSAGELARALRAPEERFAVVYNGIALAPPPERTRERRTLLAIAGPDPRKNVEALYAALTRYASCFAPDGAPDLELVCSSPRTRQRTEAALRAHGLAGVRILERPEDRELTEAYARASVFVWPSRMEGFGMPPLEAMQTGCPVVSSHALPMPEVLGEAPLYFDPERPEALATALAGLLDDPAERARRASAGREQAARYSCRRMAAGTAAVWEQALG